MKAIGFIALMIAIAFFRAFTIAKFWGYYVVGPFHLPQITMWQAYGLSILAFVFTVQHSDQKKKEDSEVIAVALTYAFLPWIAAGVLNLFK